MFSPCDSFGGNDDATASCGDVRGWNEPEAMS
jgi:hypothetical protein